MLQWKTPALSALVLLGGGFCALAGEFILRGDHTVTPLKGESKITPLLLLGCPPCLAPAYASDPITTCHRQILS